MYVFFDESGTNNGSDAVRVWFERLKKKKKITLILE